MARITVRIPMPEDPSDTIRLLRSVKKKHTELAASSPLAGLEWDKINPALERAEEQDALSDQQYRDAEKATKERNLQMNTVKAALRSARDVLLGVYRSNPKKAGDFGFTRFAPSLIHSKRRSRTNARMASSSVLLKFLRLCDFPSNS